MAEARGPATRARRWAPPSARCSLLAAAIVVPRVARFMLVALGAIPVLYRLTLWVRQHGLAKARGVAHHHGEGLHCEAVVHEVLVVCVLLSAKFVRIAAFPGQGA